jgi:hypothetical protein
MATEFLEDSQALIVLSRQRKIAGIIPHVVVEEVYEDSLEITQHPVERGATITDHAYKRPYQVEMKIGFSDATSKSAFGSTIQYENLLALQESRQPFTLFTGKRVYNNMLIASIGVVSDQRTEFAVMANIRLQQIRIAGVETFNLNNTNQTTPAQPQNTDPPKTTGPALPSLVLNPPSFPLPTG